MTDTPFKGAQTHLVGIPFIIKSLCALMLLMTSCQPTTTVADNNSETKAQVNTDSTLAQPNSKTLEVTKANTDIELEDANTQQVLSTRNQPLSIDWHAVDSGVSPIDLADFSYPFALKSNAVQAQVKFSNISPEQAQHSLTLGMVSNEPIEKIIDQLGDSYLSHSFSPKSATLFIYTTPNVTTDQHNYVIADQFAQGLTLPIVITSELPKSKVMTDATTDDWGKMNK